MPLSIKSHFEGLPEGLCACGTPGTVRLVIASGSDEAVIGPYCTACLYNQIHVTVLMDTSRTSGPKPPTKRMKRLSQKQERRVMGAIGGRTSRASGAMPSDKSDGRLLDRIRLEAKFTFARSYRITRDVLDKIRGECRGREEPAVQIDFNDKSTGRVEDSWVVIPFHLWEKYVHATADDS